jgi:prevent-host-death family protein
MAHYSVAAAKDALSSLIAKAEAGEEVIITRHGRPAVELRPAQSDSRDRKKAMEKLRAHRQKMAPLTTPIPYHRFSEWLYEDEES